MKQYTMKQQQSLALGAIIAVAVGLTGVSAFGDFTTQPELTQAERFAEESGIYGHLEATLTDSNGDIKAYRQTDNIVTTQGLNCAVEILFADAALNACPGTGSISFKVIELISAGTPVAGDVQGAQAGTAVTGNGLDIAGCTVADNGAGSVTCTNLFTKTGASSQTVTGAYLKDNTTPTAIFAGNTFTSVSMDENDTLNVVWTITLS